MSNINMWEIEDGFYAEGIKVICGVDEAGRGPLAGPVCAAAVILPPHLEIPGLTDSKKLSDKAGEVYEILSKDFMVDFDDAGSIGKRYRRQDEIGTPFCITYDFESEEDGCVTVRERDSMQQERVAIADLPAYIAERVKF